MKKASKSKTKEKKLNISKPNWFGLNHDRVAQQFEGDLAFVNDFCVNGEYNPVAVYRAANPNTAKGHKKYMLLQVQGRDGLVRGMTEEEMEKWRFQEAVHCLNCDQVVYSVMRHDMASCKCKTKNKRVFVDGGRDYTKLCFGEKSNYVSGTLDLLTDDFFLP